MREVHVGEIMHRQDEDQLFALRVVPEALADEPWTAGPHGRGVRDDAPTVAVLQVHRHELHELGMLLAREQGVAHSGWPRGWEGAFVLLDLMRIVYFGERDIYDEIHVHVDAAVVVDYEIPSGVHLLVEVSIRLVGIQEPRIFFAQKRLDFPRRPQHVSHIGVHTYRSLSGLLPYLWNVHVVQPNLM